MDWCSIEMVIDTGAQSQLLTMAIGYEPTMLGKRPKMAVHDE